MIGLLKKSLWICQSEKRKIRNSLPEQGNCRCFATAVVIFQISVNGDVVCAQNWEVLTLKNLIHPLYQIDVRCFYESVLSIDDEIT